LGRRRAAAADLAAARVQHRLLRRSRTLADAEAVLFEANHGSPVRAVALGRRVWRLAPSIRAADGVAGSDVPAARRRFRAPLGPPRRGAALVDDGGEGSGGAVAGVPPAPRRAAVMTARAALIAVVV